MAFRHGRFAEITVNSVDLSTFCDTADLSIDIDTAETTSFTSAWKTHIPGTAGGTLELSGSYDPTASTGPAAVIEGVIAGGVAVPVVAYPGGDAVGQRSRTFSAILTNYSESSAVGDKVTFSCSLLATGAVAMAAVTE
jgi:hypothetical protein